jgi:LPS-assembly protein
MIDRISGILRQLPPVCIAVFLAIALWASPCPGEETILGRQLLEDRNAHWQITADKMVYIHQKHLYVAEGNVMITRNGQILSAERGVYNENTGIVQVSGNVRLTTNGDIVSGEMALIDLENYFGQITDGTIFLRENNVYIRGSSMVRTGANTYLVKEARLTTCDGANPAWSITGEEVKVTVEGYGSVKNAAFRIKGFPAFYLPYAIFPVKTKRQTGFLPPRLGYSNQNGVDLEVPFFWAISEQVDATFYERYMTERGFMQGLEFRYAAKQDSKGTFLFDILRDEIEEKDMSDPDDVSLSPEDRTNRTRYWFRSRMDQTLFPGLQARLDTDFVSDQDYLKEFQGGLLGFDARPEFDEYGRPIQEVRSPTRRNALRLSADGEEYSLQGLSAYYQRPENPPLDGTPQPLANASYNLLSRRLPYLPVYANLSTDYGYVWRETGAEGHSFSVEPEFTYPVFLGRYLQLETSAGYRHLTQWVDDAPTDVGSQSRNVYHARARLATVLEKVFNLNWREYTAFKHKIRPSITYEFDRDDDQYRPWFEPIYAKGDVNRVTLSVENILDSRKDDAEGNVLYQQWGTFILSQPYDLDEARRDSEPWREKEPFEPLVAELNVFPFPWLDVFAETHWDHYESDTVFTDVSAEVTVNRLGGRWDRYALEYQYTEDERQYLGYRVHLNLIGGFSVGTSVRKELETDHTLDQAYWIDYRAQCWGLQLTAESLDGVESIGLTFHLLGLGNVGDF